MEQQQTFVSRADESGTHKKELSIWEKAGLTPSGDWYIEAAAGMGDVITMTDEKAGYTLSDRATWLNVGGDTALKISITTEQRHSRSGSFQRKHRS